MLRLFLILLTTLPALQVSPRTCFAPCEVRVTYRSPENARSIAIVVADADGVVTTSEEPASDHTKQRFYRLGPGDYQISLYADGKINGNARCIILSQTELHEH